MDVNPTWAKVLVHQPRPKPDWHRRGVLAGFGDVDSQNAQKTVKFADMIGFNLRCF